MEPGLKLIKIFKEYSSKTCILDDFGFYEARQKTILEKKAKQQYPKQAGFFDLLIYVSFGISEGNMSSVLNIYFSSETRYGKGSLLMRR